LYVTEKFEMIESMHYALQDRSTAYRPSMLFRFWKILRNVDCLHRCSISCFSNLCV